MAPPVSDEPHDPLRDLALSLRAGAPRGAKPGKEHKQFNKLVKDIDALRAEIAQWQAFEPLFRQRVATEIEPVIARYRESRVQLAMLLKAAIDGQELGKRQKAKASEILCWHLSEILDMGPDEQLAAIHDQYADLSLAEQRAREVARLRGMMEEVFDDQPDEDDAPSALSEDDIARFIDTRLADEDAWHARHSDAGRKRHAKAQANSSRHAQLVQDANDAVRQIYRRLASELHPDREPDAERRIRKTALMQQANQAYAASDLLTLLGLQLQVEQLDSATLSGLARERLQQYNHLLDEQRQRLQLELAALTAEFSMHVANDRRRLTPEAVERGLDREARDYKRAARQCEADVAHFRHMRNIKDALDGYQLGDLAQN